MRLLLVILSSLLLVSSQACSDVYPADCIPNKAIICTSPLYSDLVSQFCRLTCGLCLNPTGGSSSGSQTGSILGSISDPNPANTNYRTSYLNTNAAV
ncbi:hypothetical protein PENTCL1PPCAC_6889 [Pristionchus entomophagus]|uniref:ShKT domain-containing protein n=1 Tax=Pristionchus entomophagus TaxID=358040 RepID=A0AAV5SWT5_9BILA|nr:hypothetical protein PENTCL1PPCAC_6889 [Pristionchus entomophagus]